MRLDCPVEDCSFSAFAVDLPDLERCLKNHGFHAHREMLVDYYNMVDDVLEGLVDES